MFKAPFDRALSGFRSELELDVKSALEEKEKRKHTVIRGGRGSMKAKLDVSGLSYAPKATAVTPGAPADVHVPLPKAALTVPEEVEFRGALATAGEFWRRVFWTSRPCRRPCWSTSWTP